MYSQDDWDPGGMMNGSYGNGMADGGVWMMVVFGLLLAVLVGAAIFWGIKAAGSNAAAIAGPAASPVTGSPRDVLDMRLARGEINPEEYGATKTLLSP